MYLAKRCQRISKKHITIFVIIIIFIAFYMSIQQSDPGLMWDLTWKLEETQLQELLKEEMNCEMPRPETLPKRTKKVLNNMPKIICEGKDWVKCYQSQCRVVDDIIFNIEDITCAYYDIIYENDSEYSFGPPTYVKEDGVYTLVRSDHVKIDCVGWYGNGSKVSWTYCATGIRNSVERKKSPPGRENSLNILMVMFDSTSRNGFIRKLPKSYEYITKMLNGTVLKRYNIVGEGTSGALFPILTGKIEYELPTSLRKDSRMGYSLDSVPFLFFKLKEDGYRTAYFEEMPWVGTFQYKFNGFRNQPTDHYLRHFFMEEGSLRNWTWTHNNQRFCVGDTPQYQVMLSKTEQFLHLDGKRFCLTFIADLTHDKLNLLSVADETLVNFLKTLVDRDILRNTLLLIMGDHGPRYGNVRNNLNGRMEERLPFVSIILPEEFKRRRPDAQLALEANVNTWTTPYDIHTTLLDALDLPQYINQYKVPGANITRSMSLFRPIPKNRTCWEAGIRPFWCTCLVWRNVSKNDVLFQRSARSLVRSINLLTKPVRNKCAIRSLTAIKSVKRQQVNKKMRNGIDKKFQENFLVKIVASPGEAIYEASMVYSNEKDRFFVEARYISRTNAYGDEPNCISGVRPHLNMFCYCKYRNNTAV